MNSVHNLEWFLSMNVTLIRPIDASTGNGGTRKGWAKSPKEASEGESLPCQWCFCVLHVSPVAHGILTLRFFYGISDTRRLKNLWLLSFAFRLFGELMTICRSSRMLSAALISNSPSAGFTNFCVPKLLRSHCDFEDQSNARKRPRKWLIEQDEAQLWKYLIG